MFLVGSARQNFDASVCIGCLHLPRKKLTPSDYPTAFTIGVDPVQKLGNGSYIVRENKEGEKDNG